MAVGLESCRVENLGVTTKLRFGAPLIVLRLARVLREQNPDIVVVFNMSTLVLATVAWKFSGRRGLLAYDHQVDTTAVSDSVKWSTAFVGYLFELSLRACSFVIAASSGCARNLEETYHVQPERITVIGNPVDLGVAGTAIPSTSRISQRSRPRFVTAGALTSQKGHDLLIDAFAEVVRSVPTATLTIMGEGSLRKSLVRQTIRYGIQDRVYFDGYVTDIYSAFAAADIFVLSSRWEGLGNVLLEAMACNLPTIAFDCRSGPAEIIQNDLTGLLVPVGDTLGLAGAMLQLWQNPARRERIVKAASQRVRDFSAEAIAPKYEHLLTLKLGASPARAGSS